MNPSPSSTNSGFSAYPGSYQRGSLSKSPINLLKRKCEAEDELLTPAILQQIKQSMPMRYRLFSDWQLVYSSHGDGFSLTTLYANSMSLFSASPNTSSPMLFSSSLPQSNFLGSTTKRSRVLGPCLLVLKDDHDGIFGAYMSDFVRPSVGHYGSADCFLWRLNGTSVESYKATGKNQFFIISEPSFLSLGCSDGKFGLWLDSELLKGQSNKVTTFDNHPLSSSTDFTIVGVELWALSE